jgi:hypothetical protein
MNNESKPLFAVNIFISYVYRAQRLEDRCFHFKARQQEVFQALLIRITSYFTRSERS